MVPSYHSNSVAIADSGATSHFLLPNAAFQCIPTKKNITVMLPNGATLNTTTQCRLQINNLSQQAASGFALPGLAKHSLVSVSKLCDDDCEVTFDKTNVNVTKDNTTIWTGTRDPTTRLWMLPLTTTNQQQAHNVFTINTIQQQIAYLHGCAEFPPNIA